MSSFPPIPCLQTLAASFCTPKPRWPKITVLHPNPSPALPRHFGWIYPVAPRLRGNNNRWEFIMLEVVVASLPHAGLTENPSKSPPCAPNSSAVLAGCSSSSMQQITVHPFSECGSPFYHGRLSTRPCNLPAMRKWTCPPARSQIFWQCRNNLNRLFSVAKLNPGIKTLPPK